jgi:tetratricopeptide (TPR) repeat protein
MVADSRRDRRWSPPPPTEPSRLPVSWFPPDRDAGERIKQGKRRPRFGMTPEEFERRERARRRRTIFGTGAAVVGVIAFVVGFLMQGDPPDDQFDDLQRALVLQNAGQLEQAAIIYRQVIEEFPSSTIAHFNLGVIEHTQGDSEEAADSYTRAIQIDPAYVPALFNLAVIRAEAGDTDEAMDLYRRAVDLEPNNASALLNLGILLLQEGEELEATELISRAIEINPSLSESSLAG